MTQNDLKVKSTMPRESCQSSVLPNAASAASSVTHERSDGSLIVSIGLSEHAHNVMVASGTPHQGMFLLVRLLRLHPDPLVLNPTLSTLYACEK